LQAPVAFYSVELLFVADTLIPDALFGPGAELYCAVAPDQTVLLLFQNTPKVRIYHFQGFKPPFNAFSLIFKDKL
jgi:hypothetical protein